MHLKVFTNSSRTEVITNIFIRFISTSNQFFFRHFEEKFSGDRHSTTEMKSRVRLAFLFIMEDSHKEEKKDKVESFFS